MEFGHAEDAPGYAYIELTRIGLRRAEHVPIMPQPRHVVTVAVAGCGHSHHPPPSPLQRSLAVRWGQRRGLPWMRIPRWSRPPCPWATQRGGSAGNDPYRRDHRPRPTMHRGCPG